MFCAGDDDVEDAPIRMRVRGSSSAVEYTKKSFSLDPVDQIADFANADTTGLPLLGEQCHCHDGSSSDSGPHDASLAWSNSEPDIMHLACLSLGELAMGYTLGEGESLQVCHDHVLCILGMGAPAVSVYCSWSSTPG